ncbi:pyruvate formate lyase family protein [Paludicola sp. MB14-C6]|uniref:pyruvate formate lyase family protein n=1 Tax=Paludihabitans sp. MB14-C6 TaxID=3070656 RepID=UPI0027DB2DD5|nr:pyruvate formate lyase family protein [Paludicola sp. MB14-C6]WMJ22572.1 pyruvate formate lyase family protein [Paludicola sp. MB14-C6]
MYLNYKKDLDYALHFTEIYKSETDKAMREAKCLQLQIPYVLMPMTECDLIVGYMKHGYVGFSPQYGGSYTYYYWDDRVQQAIDAVKDSVDQEYLDSVEDMRDFWKQENTEKKMLDRFAQKYGTHMEEANYYYGVARIAGMTVDLDLLVQVGLSGLKERVNDYRKQNGSSSFYDALDISIDVIIDACLMYADNARAQLEVASPERREELLKIAEIFENLTTSAPKTFREGLQLIWIYAVCSDLMNFGRMDNYLSDLYVHDIENGILTEEEAVKLLSSLFRNIIKVSKVHDSRIIIGGKGRKNPDNADQLALTLIKTSRTVVDVVPQLTLRYYHGINDSLLTETLVNIEAGAVYPIVYSDDATIPAMQEIYQIDEEMAQRWVPFGCGEYVIEGYGAATPNTGMTLPQALDIVLHRGCDSFTGNQYGFDVGDPSNFLTFEDLFEAYSKLLEPAVLEEAYSEQCNYQVAGENACFLHLSLLTHDCMEKNIPIFEGGARFLCATSEIFGLVTLADSLTAIKKCVYEDKLFSLPQLIHMLDCNFKGYEKERKILLNAPKYGNDDNYADEMVVRVFNHISKLHRDAGKTTNLYGYHVVSVNNSGSAERGAVTAATPCGRHRGAPLSNGNSPSIGADKLGLTALLNSMRKVEANKHVGVVHNIRMNKDMLKNNRDKIKMLLQIFYENGGIQTNLSSIGKYDLEQAMLHPEKYQNLIVRIGGFSARFIELDPIVQNEILLRTTYEEF